MRNTLAQAFPQRGGGVWKNLKFVGACRVAEGGQLFMHPFAGLDEHDFCESPKAFVFGLHFDSIQEHSPGTLIGLQLEQIEGQYEFAREPHLQPVGIGCWDLDADLSFQKSLLEGTNVGRGGGKIARALEMSAQTVSSQGPSGTTFVAYDGRSHLLRLDRSDRISVYDLNQAKSYHLALQTGASEAQKCVVFDLIEQSETLRTDSTSFEPTSLISHRDHVLEQLVGLRPSGDEAHYLGTRLIDHQELEVYEKELRLASLGIVGSPFLLHTNRYTQTPLSKRLYATCYTSSSGGAPDDQVSLMLRCIELWDYKPTSKTRKLLNRVEFEKFSWSVGDLKPAGGISVANNVEHHDLFELAPCRQGRAAQGKLKVVYAQQEVEPDNSPNFPPTPSGQLQETVLMQNNQELRDHLHQMLAESLEISRLNPNVLELEL